MDGLAGNIETMPISDLALYLGNRRLTGTLVCEHGSARKSVSVREGLIVSAASNDPREYLGQFLINFGHITEDQLTKAFQTQTETQIYIGRILVMIGLITEETLRQALVIKLRETLLAMFRWGSGNFRFARNALPSAEAVQVEVPLLDVHREGEYREQVWDAMLKVFPNGELVLTLDDAKVPRDLPPNSADAQIFALIRERLSIDEIGLRMHATDFHLYQRLYALYRQGLITPRDPTGRLPPQADLIPVGEEMSVQQILRAARDFLASGQLLDAEQLAVRAIELDNTPETQAFQKEAEAKLLKKLRAEMTEKPTVFELAVPPARIKAMDLTPQERYLLSRIDGTRDVQVIIRVSPIRELDALKSFSRFLERGLVVPK